MARYKDYNYDQMKMIPVSFDQQILPGSFEYSLSHLIDHELDLSAFDGFYKNDEEGRPAYDPRLLLKIKPGQRAINSSISVNCSLNRFFD